MWLDESSDAFFKNRKDFFFFPIHIENNHTVLKHRIKNRAEGLRTCGRGSQACGSRALLPRELPRSTELR